MAGDTSLDEEQQLYRYFTGEEVAEDLLPLRGTFLFVCSHETG